MEKEKPLYVFEGSGAPEAKLKPRPIDNIKEMLTKCKENGVEKIGFTYDILAAISPEIFWESAAMAVEMFGEWNVSAILAIDLRAEDDTMRVIERMLDLGVRPQVATIGSEAVEEMNRIGRQVSLNIAMRKFAKKMQSQLSD